MASPFPGMNPYLEHLELWSEVHHRLIVAMADKIVESLPPRYRVAVEKRTYLSTPEDAVLVGIPDVAVLSQSSSESRTTTATAIVSPSKPITVSLPVPEEVKEGYLEIREVATGQVITVIELLSPTNKRPGEGRKTYEEKRLQVLGSRTHLVEIDLLRKGQPLPILGEVPTSDYRIVVSRRHQRPRAQLYAFGVRHSLPAFPIPLQSGEVEPVVELKPLLDGIYDRARFDLSIDYTQDPVPPLSEEDAAWVDELLREQGLR
jgi:hypothetical protein